MEAESTKGIAVVPETRETSTGDLFFEPLAEINNQIARRAYELFEANGSVHGWDIEHWARAEREILHAVPLEVLETGTGITVLAEAPGFTEKELEVRVEPQRLFIAGKREGATEQKEGKSIYSERHSRQIFRVVDLPSRIDPEGVQATLRDGLLKIILPKAVAGKMSDTQERDFQAAIRKALGEWVQALSDPDRASKCIYLSRAGYSPLEILEAVEQETKLGKEFVLGLNALQRRMVARNPSASVADLIRRSISPAAATAATA